MREITSTRAPTVALLRSLHAAKGREESGCYLAEGTTVLAEALDAGCAIRAVLVDESRLSAYEPLLARCPDWARCPQHVIASAAEVKTPQGLLAAVGIPPQANPSAWRRALALDGLQDPGNMGTLLRLCAAAGWDGLLIGAGCADPFSPKVVRSSTGLVARVSLWKGELAPMLAKLKDGGCAIAATAVEGQDFYLRPRLDRLILAIGNEARGLSPSVRAVATHTWRLPMPGGVQSLNAAMAATAMVYDEIRLEEHP